MMPSGTCFHDRALKAVSIVENVENPTSIMSEGFKPVLPLADPANCFIELMIDSPILTPCRHNQKKKPINTVKRTNSARTSVAPPPLTACKPNRQTMPIGTSIQKRRLAASKKTDDHPLDAE
jgi:hypothetical protein